jgi:acetyltransferase-like isoleucine patch superfamily enzyme
MVGEVIVGRDVLLGAHSTLLGPITVGDGAIIGAGAVVTKSVPAGEVWAGVPAKRISSDGLGRGRLGSGFSRRSGSRPREMDTP